MGTSDTLGAGTGVQVLPPLTVLSSSALHGRLLQPPQRVRALAKVPLATHYLVPNAVKGSAMLGSGKRAMSRPALRKERRRLRRSSHRYSARTGSHPPGWWSFR